MKYKHVLRTLTAIAVAGGFISTTAQAGPYGYDLHQNLFPASGAMAGTSLARPQDVPSAIFGNPATMSKLKGTQFTFAGSFYQPEVELKHDGSVTGSAFDTNSRTKVFPVPIIGVAQDLRGLGLPATMGLGVTAVSGIGTKFNGNPSTLGAGAEFIVFGINAGLGYEITENLSVGLAPTISFAQMDLGLSSTSTETHTLGIRATAGVTYDIGATTIGAYGQTKLKHNFEDLIQVDDTGKTDNVTIEQPETLGLGIANNNLMDGDLLLMADFLYKFWNRARFWEDVYDNQKVVSVGAQLTRGKWKYRVGYGYAEDPTESNASAPIGGLTQVAGGIGGPVIPLTDPVVAYLQAAETPVIYEHRVAAGLGYEGFLLPNLDVDLNGGWQFENDRDYGSGSLSGGGSSRAEVHSWYAGFGATWRFDN